MRILHISPSLKPEWGGVAKAAKGLTQALARKGAAISIFTLSEGGEDMSLRHEMAGINIRYFPKSPFSRLWTGFSLPLVDALKKEISDFDLVHIHGIWHYPNFAAYKAAKDARMPFIISIHGSLEPWALRYKALKKGVCAVLFQKKVLEEASGLVAVTEQEAKSINRFVKNEKIFIAANGINIEEFSSLPRKDRFNDSYPGLRGRKIILFLGRLHPVKGLDLLTGAFGRVLKEREDVQLVIAGPYDENYKRSVAAMLKREGALDNTTFTGMLTGDDRLAVLSRSDIFVLPSYTEVMGLSTLEAMACGLPVVITKGCNFPEVETSGSGIIVNQDSASMSSAIKRLLADKALSRRMGMAGKRLVEGKYTWDKTADRILEIYEEGLCQCA